MPSLNIKKGVDNLSTGIGSIKSKIKSKPKPKPTEDTENESDNKPQNTENADIVGNTDNAVNVGTVGSVGNMGNSQEYAHINSQLQEISNNLKIIVENFVNKKTQIISKPVATKKPKDEDD